MTIYEGFKQLNVVRHVWCGSESQKEFRSYGNSITVQFTSSNPSRDKFKAKWTMLEGKIVFGKNI